MSGIKIAALYGVVTNRLGFCGPQRKTTNKTILDYISGKKISEQKLRKIFQNFKGAFPYYELIAKTAKISDPFDEKVVKAYWIGNKLLDKVGAVDLRQMIFDEYSATGFLRKRDIEKKVKKISKNSKPHHSFHVLTIGSVSGRIFLTKNLIDICRIGWGKVIKLDKDKEWIRVEYRPLILNKKARIGPLRLKYLVWDINILPKIKIGNLVSCHWNHAIQLLQKKDVENLRKYTQKTLDSLNFCHY